MITLFAAGLYDIWVIQAVYARWWVVLAISGVSLLAALPPKLRRKGRWHSLAAAACAGLFMANTLYLETTMHRGLPWNPVLIGYFLIPAALAGISVFLTRRKNA